VNVHWHCIASNLERISKISRLPPGKVSADARASDLKIFKFLAFFRHVLIVSCLQIQQTKYLNYRNFDKPFLCNVQNLET